MQPSANVIGRRCPCHCAVPALMSEEDLAPQMPADAAGQVTAVPRRRAAVAFIMITVVLDVMAMGLILPVTPHLVEVMTGGDTAVAAFYVGMFSACWALMQFLASPILGALSDRFGRRRVILISNAGLAVAYVLSALAPNLLILFISRLLNGIMAASITTANAYIADVTPPERRAQAFGLLGASFGIGFVLGPAFGGTLGDIDIQLPFWVAAGFSLANAAYGFFVLPESLPPERRTPAFSWKRANPVGSLVLLRRHRELFGLASVHFFNNLAHTVLPAIFVLYASYRYGWSMQMVGISLGAVGIANMIVQGGLVRPAVKRLGERRLLLTGLCAAATGIAIYGLAPVGWMFWLGLPFGALWGFYGAGAQSLMTRHVEPSEQGQLQGALGAIVGISGMIGPAMFSTVFAQTLHVAPGAAFLLASSIMVLAATLAWRVTRREG